MPLLHVLACDITGWCMNITGQCTHVLHALPHDVTGWCMQLLHGLCLFDFISDIPLALATLHFCGPIQNDTHTCQSSWSKGISETNLKLKIPCHYCMYWPVTSQADAWTSQANARMYCMHCYMMSKADACSYCMCSVVLISSKIYL
jgi:hypothetical protein